MNIRQSAALFVALLCAVSVGSADMITPGAGSTTVVDAGSVVVNDVAWWADMGEFYGNGRAYVVPVLLPTLPAGATFGDADIAFGHHGPGAHPIDGRTGFFGGAAPDYNIDLYGLSRLADEGTVLDTDHYSGPADPTATLLQDAYLDPNSPGNRAVIHNDLLGSTSLTAWLNTMYADGANAGKYVFLRLNPDAAEGTLPWSGYEVMTSLAGGDDEKPVLTYTVVPEPSGIVLLCLGLLAWRRR